MPFEWNWTRALILFNGDGKLEIKDTNNRYSNLGKRFPNEGILSKGMSFETQDLNPGIIFFNIRVLRFI